jgi:hypothetical protein
MSELPDWAEMGAPPPPPDAEHVKAALAQAQRATDAARAAHDAARDRERALGVTLLVLTSRIGSAP